MENINNSDGVNRSDGVNGSDGVNRSDGVNWSYGVNRSDGVNGSYGVNWSYGVNRSYGILNCYGVDKAIFLANKKRSYSIFGKEVTEERFNEVWGELHAKLNGWYPKFNNAVFLYLKSGKDWKKVNASEICGTLNNWDKPYEAWKDIPQEALDFIKSLTEFDAEMFKIITGIDVSQPSLIGSDVEVKVNGKVYKARIVE